MTKSSLTIGEVRDQYSAYEDTRFKDTLSYEKHGENFDNFIKEYTAKIRAEAFREAAAELQSNVVDDTEGNIVQNFRSSIYDVAAAQVRYLAETEEISTQ